MKNVASKMDITLLPKEVLFNLLLQVQPNEIGVVCTSKNSNVRTICKSKLFQDEYKKKFPKKLLTGKIKKDYDYENRTYIFTDENGNRIKIYLDRHGETDVIEYIPYKQQYPSTYIRSDNGMVLSENILRSENPFIIRIAAENGNLGLYIGRDRVYGVFTNNDDERYQNSYRNEIKEFLKRLEKPNWWDEKYQFNKSFGTEEVRKDFYFEVVKALQDVEIDNKPIWQIIKPFKF